MYRRQRKHNSYENFEGNDSRPGPKHCVKISQINQFQLEIPLNDSKSSEKLIREIIFNKSIFNKSIAPGTKDFIQLVQDCTVL